MVRGRTPEVRAGVDAAPRLRRSIRRGLAVLTATALASVALPMAVAAAAPSAGAVLLAGKDVIPGTAAYQITVSNSKPLQGLAGGETINYVDILLPSSIGIKTAAPTETAPLKASSGTWSTRTTSMSGLQTYTFRGGSIEPGGSLTFSFPAAVAAPTADRTGAFEVAVSSDDGKTTSGAAGALSTTIRTLQVVEGSLGASSPTGVTDQSGTAGQSIDYTLRVKNLAKGSQTVTAALSSSGADEITQAAAQPLASGATGIFVPKVKLAGSSDRTSTFTGSATATGSEALATTRAFEVQAPAALTVLAADFEPKFTTGKTSEVWSLGLSKTNKPKLTLNTGSLTLPVGVSAGLIGASPTLDDGIKRTLTFGPAQVNAANGKYDVGYTFTGTDDNGFAYTSERLSGSLTNVLTVDALAPVIKDLAAKLPLDADGRQQTAASNDGDVISVSGKIEDNSPISDCKTALQFVRLTTDKGVKVPVANATATGSGTTVCNFSGSVTTSKSPATFPGDTLSFKAEAGAKDDTGTSVSAATIDSIPVDLVVPVFNFAETRGTGSRADQILVGFADAGTVYGACNPTQWMIDENLPVTRVLFSNNQPCEAGKAGPDNDRILVLQQPRDQDMQTNVTYTPGTRPVADRATDRAGQDALTNVVKTAIGVAPAAPVIVKATRTGADGKRQDATLDEGKFFTNRTHDDLLVEFTGGRAGYFVQVLDKDGNKLGGAQDASTGLVTVPVGDVDGEYVRSIVLINTNSKVSDKTALTVVLDRIAPKLGTVSKTGTNSVSVTFTEKLAGGSNFAEDWFVFEKNPNQDPTDPDDDRAYYQVSSVDGTGDTRTINTNRALAGIGDVGADYVQRSPSGTRYVDRAGNVLANTV